MSTRNSNSGMKIIIGAGGQRWEGWTPTGKEELNLLDEATWAEFFGGERAGAFLCEHVLEHLTIEQGKRAAKTIYRYLKPGGFIRVAVPDRNFRDPEYQKMVQVGGPGPKDHPAADHKVVYDYRQLADVFRNAGFEVHLLEYHDESGSFHVSDWNPDQAPVYRSSKMDHRNRDGIIRFASIIVDAVKASDPDGK